VRSYISLPRQDLTEFAFCCVTDVTDFTEVLVYILNITRLLTGWFDSEVILITQCQKGYNVVCGDAFLICNLDILITQPACRVIKTWSKANKNVTP